MRGLSKSSIAFYILSIFSFGYSNVYANPLNDSSIVHIDTPEGWIVSTANSAYQLVISPNDQAVREVFYGPIEQFSFGKKNSQWTDGEEIPVRGAFADKTPALEVIFSDNVRDIELHFVSAKTENINGRQTLQITQEDKFYPLQVISYIRPLPEYDIIEKWIEVKNIDKKNDILIENLQSGSFSVAPGSYDLIHMAGNWGREFQNRRTNLTEGVKTIEARDFKSFVNSNWFMIRPANENMDTSGAAWFGTLQYSGNWRFDFDKSFDGRVQVVGGINFWDTHWNLVPGQTLTSPKFICGFTTKGSEGASGRMRKYVRETVLRKEWRDKLRPVLYNSWYATTFNVNEEQQLKLAKRASEMGVELFVIDDGWFKGRVDDHAGLGDWTVDSKKFPNGLGSMIKKINEMGMDFGIWIEPEMVNPNSDLYRNHPDWAFYFPNRTKHEGRHQLMLNLAREDVFLYLERSISDLLRKNNIKFIKWDHNRTLSEPGWPDAPEKNQREVRIRYINNLYRLIDTLQLQFPDVLFEDCSSGGGRVDLGMLARMDQAWASDDTDPANRILIQYGFLNAFPANTMVSWITDEDWYKVNPSLEYRFDVAMSGVLGVGFDITKWTEKEINLGREKIGQYKRIRSMVQFGDLYRLISPFEKNQCALQYVSANKTESVVFLYNMAKYLNGTFLSENDSRVVKLQGLDPHAEYSIPILGNLVYKGDFLMNIGLEWPLNNAYTSKILEIKKIEK